jgi:hypothetical protein
MISDAVRRDMRLAVAKNCHLDLNITRIIGIANAGNDLHGLRHTIPRAWKHKHMVVAESSRAIVKH